ncbi:MAG: DUF1801 domain-containing protein [Pseudomonadota bacterium]
MRKTPIHTGVAQAYKEAIAMHHKASSPEDYLAVLDEDWRKDTLMQLRALILKAGPDLEETIHYKMLGYGKGDRFAFHLNAQKAYVSLYAGDTTRHDPDGTLLSGLSTGKGCIRFSKTKPVAQTKIDVFIGQALAAWERGEKTGC